jgi:hypothetical protein
VQGVLILSQTNTVSFIQWEGFPTGLQIWNTGPKPFPPRAPLKCSWTNATFHTQFSTLRADRLVFQITLSAEEKTIAMTCLNHTFAPFEASTSHIPDFGYLRMTTLFSDLKQNVTGVAQNCNSIKWGQPPEKFAYWETGNRRHFFSFLEPCSSS